MIETAPEGWFQLELTLEYFSVGMASYECTATSIAGTEPIDVAPDARRFLRDLRFHQVEAEVDPFTVAVLTVTNAEGGPKFDLQFDYRTPKYEPD